MAHRKNPLYQLREKLNAGEDSAIEDIESSAGAVALEEMANGGGPKPPAGGPTSPGYYDMLVNGAKPIRDWVNKVTDERMPGYQERAEKTGSKTLLPGAFATDPARWMETMMSATAFAPSSLAGSAVGKVAQGILPLLMGANTAANKPTDGETAESMVSMGANALRSIPGMAIPGVAKAAQPFVAGGLEGILGSAAQQSVDTGSVDPGQAAKSGALNAFFNLLPGYIGKGGRDNAVTGRSEVLENSPFSRFNTVGVKKDFSEIQKSTDNYLQSLERTKKGGTAAPQDYISRKFYREAGFNDSPEDISLLKRLRDSPDETISDVMGKALNFDPDKTLDVNIVKMNRQLNKVVDLFGKSKSSEVLKDKAGEIIVSSFLSPAADSPRNVKRMFEKLEKGGNSAFDKIFTPEQKAALLEGVAATQKIREIGHIKNAGVRMGQSGGGFWVAIGGDRLVLLTPSNLATALLQDPGKSAVMKDVAKVFENAAKNPLAGGRVPRAIVDKLKGAFGAREMSTEEARQQGETPRPGEEASFSNVIKRAFGGG